MHHRSVLMRMTSVPRAPREARHTARVVLEDWEVPDSVTQDALLVISELVTNAVRHADDSRIDMELDQDDRVLRVALVDGSPELPRVRRPRSTAEDGRGLRILSALADRWGVDPCERGKRVWWEVDLPQATAALATASASA